ncbi:gp436 family protein [Billgrantia gudaonensis]|uniref:Mu-like prophage protein gp36 n=1 Tax=Billgrantia gudaonensis TaxID=376427 RepID=A0A1G9AXA1_9GAMM|nr:DUF1320 domain-containing protein [Halomonas gudaonensis]SDK31961.1 Mu-like prophage protein gp36 [Halomonas gudaonensis]
MPYCTQADLVERFGENELLDLAADDTGTAIDATIVDRAIEDAAGEIDGYVAAAGNSVPLESPPRIVTAVACDIARYRLYDDRATEQVTKRYDDAMKFLRAVAKGDVKLGISAPAEASAGEVQFETGGRVMPGGGF